MGARVIDEFRKDWPRKVFGYATPDGKPFEVEGFVRGCWGIFMKIDPVDGKDAIGYSLTHVPTGLRLAFFADDDYAADAADIADRFADWSTMVGIDQHKSAEWQAVGKQFGAALRSAGYFRFGGKDNKIAGGSIWHRNADGADIEWMEP